MYAQERQRKSQLQAVTANSGSIEDYLQSLDMKMHIGLDDISHLQRLSQLTQKTNQFNLTTRRYDESKMAEKIEDKDALVYHFTLADKFGDSGIVGLAIVERLGEMEASLDTFLMSCRVIGRCAEQAFLSNILLDLKQRRLQTLSAEYLPTRKNVLVESFLPDNGFKQKPDGGYYIELQSLSQGKSDDFPITIEGSFQK